MTTSYAITAEYITEWRFNMAIAIHELKQPYSIDETIQYLQEQTDNFGLFFDLDRLLEYEVHFRLQSEKLRKEVMKGLGFPKFKLTDNNIIPILTKLGIPDYKFTNKYDETSFDKNVRAQIIADESIDQELRNIVEAYHKYKAVKYMISYIPQYTSLPLCNMESYNGHRMVVAHPTWNKLRTFRIAAADPSLQNIPRFMKDIITSPNGWRLYRCDSGQIEPRITYSWQVPDKLIASIITTYNDAYAGLLHYANLTDEEDAVLRKDFSKFVKMELNDDFKSMRQDLKVLALSANYGSKNLRVDPALAEKYNRRIVNHPLRLQFEAEVKEQVARGVESFKTAFGNIIEVEETAKYKRGTKAWKGHVERCGMNNGIQGTASELMLFSVNESKKIINEHPETHIAFYKHDEGAFYVKDDEYKEVTSKLFGITAYNVDGWIPIDCEAEEGQLKSEEVPSVLCEI